MGATMAPVDGSGSCPTWMARVLKPAFMQNILSCYNCSMSCLRGTAILLLLLTAMPLSAGGKDYTEIKLVVTDADKGTPIPKAAVTLTFVRGKNLFGKKDRAQWDVKTDSRGNATVPFIPRIGLH